MIVGWEKYSCWWEKCPEWVLEQVICWEVGGGGWCVFRAWGHTRLADGQSWQTTDSLETSQLSWLVVFDFRILYDLVVILFSSYPHDKLWYNANICLGKITSSLRVYWATNYHHLSRTKWRCNLRCLEFLSISISCIEKWEVWWQSLLMYRTPAQAGREMIISGWCWCWCWCVYSLQLSGETGTKWHSDHHCLGITGVSTPATATARIRQDTKLILPPVSPASSNNKYLHKFLSRVLSCSVLFLL